ncbi:MAG: ERCC4 domain-containing protein [Desulfobaccales bacterium]
MKILIDSREQTPFLFRSYDVTPEVVGLPVGDYSLPGFQDRAAIERKSLNDLVGCLMNGNRERFERELARGRCYELFAVVVEANLSDVSQGRYRSEMKPQAALQSITAFIVRYRVPFLFCGNRAGAEYMTYSLLSKYLREIGEKYRQATKAQEAGAQEKAA